MDDELRHIPQPIRKDGAGATDLGPRDVLRDIENPDMLVPPKTDAGTIPNLKFSFSDTHMHLNHGGWSREITKRELPVSKRLQVSTCGSHAEVFVSFIGISRQNGRI
ncbi:hypothetical protein BSAF29S_00472 [Bacillus safensis subsp. safensis]